jgi:ribosomal protein L16 Arg81 hydroxylase
MVRVLKDWAPEAQRLVRPGDMLYLPPRVAHHGVATAPGQTLSIGALAPRHEVDLPHFPGETYHDVSIVRIRRSSHAACITDSSPTLGR